MPVSAAITEFLRSRRSSPSFSPHWLRQGVNALLGVGTLLFFGASASLADVVSDSSAQSLVTNSSCLGIPCVIFGGHQQGSHLFHSFSEFVIPAAGNALLIPPANNSVEKIFIRVVGPATEIHGGFTVGNQGFPLKVIFLSPQGITIGDNAQLSYPGDFLLSTAERLDFGNGVLFNATDNSIPLLNISGLDGLPQALELGGSPGFINFDGSLGFGNISIPQTRHQFSVVGGAVNFDSVEISTPGTIHIGAVENSQVIELDFSGIAIDFDYDAVSAFEAITLDNSSLLTRSLSASNDAGDIRVIGDSLTLNNSGKIVSGSSNPIYFNAGNVKVDLENNLILSGNSEISTISMTSDAGNLDISASNLSLRDQSFILSRAHRNGGDLAINLTGDADLNTSSYLLLEMTDNSVNPAGDLIITGQSLNLADNSRILHRTSDGGGNLTIDFNNDVILNDASQVGTFLTDSGRNILQGDAGNISIEAEDLTLNTDSKILTTTADMKGNIVLDLSGDLSVIGDASQGSQIITQIADTTGAAGMISVSANAVYLEKGLLLTETDQPGGDININAANTIQLDQSEIKLSSRTGAGHTGNLELTAQSTVAPIGISLINTEILNEATNTGGNVSFSTPAEVELRDGSFISIDSSGANGNFSVAASAFRSNGIANDNDVQLNQGALSHLSLPTDVTGFDVLASQVTRGNGNSELLPVPLSAAVPPISSSPANSSNPPSLLPVIAPLVTNPTVEPLETPTSIPSSPDSEDNIPPAYSAFKYLSSQVENVIALERLLPFYGSASSSGGEPSWRCSGQASHWKISGRGGIRIAPSHLNASPSIADLGAVDGEMVSSSNSTSSRLVTQSPNPSQGWREAQAWQKNQRGKINLIVQSNFALAQPKTHSCQSLP